MLNPDGAERYARRNAQAIDINRDALQLSTPEGRVLKAVRDRLQPELGFNLHDQNRRTTVGDTGVLATISLLAVSGDAQGTLTPGRARAKRVCSAIARTLEPFVPGGIGRYDEDWNPRAFGDNVTAWGTPVVLIESGGVMPGRPLTDLTRLNYVALLTTLHGLVRDDLRGETADLYEGLKRNDDGWWTDVLLAGGRIWQPDAGEPYRADVAFDVLDEDPFAVRCSEPGWPGDSRVREVGDGRLLGAARRLDVTGRLLAPACVASVHGLAAQEWLDAETLAAIGRLGVARLRWHVAAGDRPAAFGHAVSFAGAGLPSIEIVDESVLARAPRDPRAADGARVADARGRPRRPHRRLVARPGRRPPARRAVGDLAGLALRRPAPRPGHARVAARPAPPGGGRPRRGPAGPRDGLIDGREPAGSR